MSHIITPDGQIDPAHQTTPEDKTGNYVHLHVHTTYSVLDGISRREDIIKRAKDFGMPAVAITEHGNIHQAISWFKSCVEANIQPIIGMEAYVAPDDRFGRTYAKKGEAEEDAKNGDLSMSAYHLTILAKNRQGYENLKKISSLAYREGFYRKPRIDDQLLAENKEGLIVLSGCLAGKIARLIIAGNMPRALEEVDKQRAIFGDDFYLEVMNHNIPEESVVVEALKGFAKQRGIGMIMTGDSHFTEHGDEHAHDIALAIGTGKTMQDPNRWSFNGDGYWFKSAKEMRSSAESAGIPEEALTNTIEIQKKIQDYDFKLVSKTKKSIIPLFRMGGVPLTDDQCRMMLEMKARQGLAERKLAHLPEYQERLTKELAMITKKEFSSYFLIIADIIDFMRSKGMIIPMGRGSSVGSLVCYSLFITGLDPVRLKIPFSRFINEGRKDLPDVDTDISQERRGEVIEYIVNKYGKDRVAQIVTFQTMASKGAADNVGRALGIPSSVRTGIGKLIGEVEADDTLDDIFKDNPAVEVKMNEHPQWVEVAKKLEGNVRNLGAHAAGIVISNEPLMDYVPLIRDSKEGFMVTQYDMQDCGELGLLKLDMLGLKTLDLIHKTIELIKERHGVTLDFHNFPAWDNQDPASYQTIASGKFVSCFQYDSAGIRGAAKALMPVNFDHLMALNALYRPGPMKKVGGQPSVMEQYFERRHGRQAPDTWHPELDNIFKETYGLPLYQEEVMAMTQVIAGFNDQEADEYRAAIGKKDAVKFKAAQVKFKERGLGIGRDEKLMDSLIAKLEGFARYGWNIGHSAAYSYISFVTAYLETHYALEYYTELLNVNLDDNDKLKVLLSSIIQKGVKLLPPHINHSGPMFQTDGTSIYMGLYSVRQLGESALEGIMADRTANGPYTDYVDFCLRMTTHSRVNKLVKENLVKAGAFAWDKSYGQKTKVDNTELIQKIINKFKDKIPPNEIRTEIEARIAPALHEYTDQEKLDLERLVLNFYISSHPVLQYQAIFELFPHLALITPCQLNDQAQGSRVIMLGLIEEKKSKTTKDSKPFLALKVGDNLGSIQQNIWSPLCIQVDPTLVPNGLVLLSGQVKEDKFKVGDNQLSVYGVMPINALHGIPITSFYGEDIPTCNRILTLLNVPAASISDKLLNQGHLVMLKEKGYIKPEIAHELRKCGRAHYQLSV